MASVLVQGGVGDAVPGPETALLVDGDELVRLRHQVETLGQAVESSRLIGAAVGLIMAQHRLTRAAAFEMLVAQSQRSNLKVAAIAERLVAEAEDRPSP